MRQYLREYFPSAQQSNDQCSFTLPLKIHLVVLGLRLRAALCLKSTLASLTPTRLALDLRRHEGLLVTEELQHLTSPSPAGL